MKIKVFIISLLCYTSINAQNFGDTSSFFIIKGHVNNLKDHYFEYAITDYFSNFGSSVMVDDKGNFFKKIAIENFQQDIYLYLNDDALTFSVMKDDTLDISWDENKFRNSFKIIAQNKLRQNVLNAQWAEYLNFRDPYSILEEKLFNNTTINDSTKFLLVNSLFNKELTLLMDSVKYESSFESLYPHIYFKYSKLLFSQFLGRVPKYELKPDTFSITNKKLIPFIKRINYCFLDENLFWNSVDYRDFIYYYLKFNHPFSSYNIAGYGKEAEDKKVRTIPTLDNYYIALGTLKIIPIRDWFITKMILDDYNFYKTDDVQVVSDFFNQQLKDIYLKQLIADKYATMTTLRKGQPAPSFTLKNENGENISLNDFKGKVVYLDFWGVSCGPCVFDIEHFGRKLHDAYKAKGIVFISVCVDSNEKDWKNGINKYKMNDVINLIAEGWNKNPVCKAYGIEGIPHYLLIGKDGRMYNNNASRMEDMLLSLGHNEIDELLSK